MFKKLAVIAAASTMVFASTAAQAGSASALSLRNASPVEARASSDLGTRAGTSATNQSNVLGGTALYAAIGIFAVVVLLEATEVINIFGGGDDEPDSP